jgi:carboxyl-terminal processing protease
MLSFAWFSCFAQQAPGTVGQQAIMLRRLLEKHHYQPRPVDDELSRQVFRRFIRMLDSRHLYFTAADLSQLMEHSTRLDEELKGKPGTFIPLITRLYGQRLAAAAELLDATVQKPFDFAAGESLTFSHKDSLHFAADEKELALRWHKWLKYQTLIQLSHTREAGSAPAQEPAVRQKARQTEKRNIDRILQHPGGFENYVADLFLNAVTLCFDPHTLYLSKTDLQNYEGGMSKETLSFGLNLLENEAGEVNIAGLVPGGPAWQSNELHKGDVLVSLKWTGKSTFDLTGADLEEVGELLQSSNAARLELTVRKASGITKTVSLLKEKVREDENIVKSFVLKGDKRIGYITLPGFYTGWDNRSGQGCANDVAKEIVKLQKEKIEGLILDIRYNGGGSLQEGLDLAGIFIDEGPLGALKGRTEKPTLLKDMNRGTIYDGPLVLMINGQSASASELLAATLQDYNRAVVVGSPTFGKGTAQIVVPLDSTISLTAPAERKARSPYGFVTVTTEKFYRITGKSAQLHGVQPDIRLPELYQGEAYRESSYPFALPSDSLNRKMYYTALKPLPVSELTSLSAGRIGTNASFGVITNFGKSVQSLTAESGKTIPLQLAYFRQKAEEIQRWQQDLEKALEQATSLYTVQNTAYDQELMKIDGYSNEINATLLQKILKDIYITEAYQITKDLISLQTNSR